MRAVAEHRGANRFVLTMVSTAADTGQSKIGSCHDRHSSGVPMFVDVTATFAAAFARHRRCASAVAGAPRVSSGSARTTTVRRLSALTVHRRARAVGHSRLRR